VFSALFFTSCWRVGSVGRFGFVLYLACQDEDLLLRRLLKRGESGPSGRADDDEATIRKRFRVNRRECEPVVAHYRKHDKNRVREVDAAGSPEDVYTPLSKVRN
jgi:UMP-CMP kinase